MKYVSTFWTIIRCQTHICCRTLHLWQILAGKRTTWIAFGLFSFSLVIMLRIDTQSGNQGLKYLFSVISAYQLAQPYALNAKNTHCKSAPVNQTYKQTFSAIHTKNFFIVTTNTLYTKWKQ